MTSKHITGWANSFIITWWAVEIWHNCLWNCMWCTCNYAGSEPVIGSEDIRIKILFRIWKIYCQVNWLRDGWSLICQRNDPKCQKHLSSKTFLLMGTFDLDEDLIPLTQSPRGNSLCCTVKSLFNGRKFIDCTIQCSIMIRNLLVDPKICFSEWNLCLMCWQN